MYVIYKISLPCDFVGVKLDRRMTRHKEEKILFLREAMMVCRCKGRARELDRSWTTLLVSSRCSALECESYNEWMEIYTLC